METIFELIDKVLPLTVKKVFNEGGLSKFIEEVPSPYLFHIIYDVPLEKKTTILGEKGIEILSVVPEL
jgi:hypothetical protein